MFNNEPNKELLLDELDDFTAQHDRLVPEQLVLRGQLGLAGPPRFRIIFQLFVGRSQLIEFFHRLQGTKMSIFSQLNPSFLSSFDPYRSEFIDESFAFLVPRHEAEFHLPPLPFHRLDFLPIAARDAAQFVPQGSNQLLALFDPVQRGSELVLLLPVRLEQESPRLQRDIFFVVVQGW